MAASPSPAALHPAILAIDAEAEASRIAARMRELLARDLRRRGFVIAMSGGVDSAVCAALAVRAVGAGKVQGLMLPERDSSPASLERAVELAGKLGIRYEIEDIGPALDAIGCYARRDAAIRAVFPDYRHDWKSKIAIAGGRAGGFNYFRLVVRSPDGRRSEARLGPREYLQIVAATNFKQRTRKMVEYYHADRLNYAVVGTPNLLEYDQGFFVKNGDGAADVKPIAHLYKTQVYMLARHLGVPAPILDAAPTTDTYSLEQGQDEFYFALDYERMDVALWAFDHGVPAEDLGRFLGMAPGTASAIYRDIVAKREATRYQHAAPVLLADASGGGR